MKKCPFCAEEIQNEAIKCRHCGSELSQPSSPRDASPTLAPQVSFPADTSLLKKQIGCGPALTVVLAFFVAVGVGSSSGILGFILFVSAVGMLVIYRKPATVPRVRIVKRLAVTTLFGVLLGYAAREGRARRTPTSSAQPQSAAPAAQSAQQIIEAKIGDQVEVGHFLYRVEAKGFYKTLGTEYSPITADGVFLVVKIKIMNQSQETRMLDSSLFRVTDQANLKYEPSTKGATALMTMNWESLFLKQCQPNVLTSGHLVFELPNTKGLYRLHLSGGYLTGKSAMVQLN